MIRLNYFHTFIQLQNSSMPPKKNANTSKANKSKVVETGKEEKKGGNAVKVNLLHQIIKIFLSIYVSKQYKIYFLLKSFLNCLII